MLTEAFLTGATGQILFCAVCVNVFVCLGIYNIYDIHIYCAVKIRKLFEIYYTEFFFYLFLKLHKSVSLGNVCKDIVLCISSGIKTLLYGSH